MRRFAIVLALVLSSLRLAANEPYLVKDIDQNLSSSSSFPDHFATLGNLAVFSTTDNNGIEKALYRTDGSDAGTFLLASTGFGKVVWNNRVWFIETDGREPIYSTTTSLWSTDGTVAGTSNDATGTAHGFVLRHRQFTRIDDPLGSMGSWVSGIASSGEVVGYYQARSGLFHGYVATPEDQ